MGSVVIQLYGSEFTPSVDRALMSFFLRFFFFSKTRRRIYAKFFFRV